MGRAKSSGDPVVTKSVPTLPKRRSTSGAWRTLAHLSLSRLAIAGGVFASAIKSTTLRTGAHSDATVPPAPGLLSTTKSAFIASPTCCVVSTRSQAVMVAMLRDDRLLSLAPSSIVRPLVASGQIVALKVDVPATIEPIGALRPDALRNEASRAFLADTQAFAARLAG